MSRAENIKNKWRKVRQRMRLLKNLWFGSYPYQNRPNEPAGKFTNNNYVNNGGRIKTNVRKAHSNYRRPGGYGKDKNWCPHDQRQIDDMDSQEFEIINHYDDDTFID